MWKNNKRLADLVGLLKCLHIFMTDTGWKTAEEEVPT